MQHLGDGLDADAVGAPPGGHVHPQDARVRVERSVEGAQRGREASLIRVIDYISDQLRDLSSVKLSAEERIAGAGRGRCDFDRLPRRVAEVEDQAIGELQHTQHEDEEVVLEGRHGGGLVDGGRYAVAADRLLDER